MQRVINDRRRASTKLSGERPDKARANARTDTQSGGGGGSARARPGCSRPPRESSPAPPIAKVTPLRNRSALLRQQRKRPTHTVPVQNCPLGSCKSGPAEAHMLHFVWDLQMPERDGHVPQQRRTKTKGAPARAPSKRHAREPIGAPAPPDVTAPRCRRRGKARRNSMFFLRQVKRRRRPQLQHVGTLRAPRPAPQSTKQTTKSRGLGRRRRRGAGGWPAGPPRRHRCGRHPEWPPPPPRHVARETSGQMPWGANSRKNKPNQCGRGSVAAMECKVSQRKRTRLFGGQNFRDG